MPRRQQARHAGYRRVTRATQAGMHMACTRGGRHAVVRVPRAPADHTSRLCPSPSLAQEGEAVDLPDAMDAAGQGAKPMVELVVGAGARGGGSIRGGSWQRAASACKKED